MYLAEVAVTARGESLRVGGRETSQASADDEELNSSQLAAKTKARRPWT